MKLLLDIKTILRKLKEQLTGKRAGNFGLFIKQKIECEHFSGVKNRLLLVKRLSRESLEENIAILDLIVFEKLAHKSAICQITLRSLKTKQWIFLSSKQSFYNKPVCLFRNNKSCDDKTPWRNAEFSSPRSAATLYFCITWIYEWSLDSYEGDFEYSLVFY